MLLSTGASDEINYFLFKIGLTALMLAAGSNRLIAVELLLQLGADVNAVQENVRVIQRQTQRYSYMSSAGFADVADPADAGVSGRPRGSSYRIVSRGGGRTQSRQGTE